MEKFIITGGNKIKGETTVTGSKNAALKALVAACMTDEKVTIHNIPLITDLFILIDILQVLGADIEISGHSISVQLKKLAHSSIPLEKAALVAASSMFIAPLLARSGEATIPNPGGCRLGARPIDRTIEGVEQMNVNVTYHSEDGYFHARTKGLKGTRYRFKKNTHTGTETMILAAVIGRGDNYFNNAAEEPEIDDLISLLNAMGGNVTRSNPREITIVGVETLHGAEYTISPDRIEVVTFAIAAVLTGGDIFIKDAHLASIDSFLEKYKQDRSRVTRLKKMVLDFLQTVS